MFKNARQNRLESPKSKKSIPSNDFLPLNAGEMTTYCNHIRALRTRSRGATFTADEEWIRDCLKRFPRDVKRIMEGTGLRDDRQVTVLSPYLLEEKHLPNPKYQRILRLCYDLELGTAKSKFTFSDRLEQLVTAASPQTYHQDDAVLVMRCGGEGKGENWLPSPISPAKRAIVVALKGDGLDLIDRCRIADKPLDYFVDEEFLKQLTGPEAARKRNSLIVVHGESGSGKTLGMIAIAVRHFQCDIVIHVELPTILREEKHLEEFENDQERFLRLKKAAQGRARISMIVDGLKELLESAEVYSAVRDQKKVVLILDEVGSFPEYVRRLCVTHRKIAKRLKKCLNVDDVRIVCGGTGADAQALAGSNPKDYLLCHARPPERSKLLDWLRSQSAEKCQKIYCWLARPSKSRLAHECLAMLSNWRAGTYLMTSLTALPLEGEVERHPREIQRCLRTAMVDYRSANALRNLREREAIATLELALAFETLALQHPVVESRSRNPLRQLFTSLGVLTDTWTPKRRPEVGKQRYVMSPALRLIAVQNFGLKGEVDGSGCGFESDMCRYFYLLFQAASLIPVVLPGHNAVAVLLRRPANRRWGAVRGNLVPSHGMQLKYNAIEKVTFCAARDPGSFDALPLTKSATGRETEMTPATRGARCLTLHFKKKLQPVLDSRMGEETKSAKRQRAILKKIAEGHIAKVKKSRIRRALPSMHELMEESKKTDILIVKNGPQAAFADLLIVNNLTKELWLVQCKSFQRSPNFTGADELATLGHADYPQKPGAALYREALKQALGMTTVRYFLCIFVASKLNAEGKEYFPNVDLAQMFPQPLPRDVFVLSNAFGFQFTPVDLQYLNGDAAEAREWLENEDIRFVEDIVDNDFESLIGTAANDF